MAAPLAYFLIAFLYTIFWLGSKESTYSMSYYALPDNKKWIFTFFTWGIALTGMAMYQSTWMAVGAGGIIIVGIAGDFVVRKVYDYVMPDGSIIEKEKRIKGIVYWMHMAGTFIGVGFSQSSIWFEHGMWYLTVAFIVAVPVLWFLGGYRKLGWIELTAITTSLIGGLIIR